MERIKIQPPDDYEQERAPEITFSSPVNEILHSSEKSAELWPDLAEQIEPQIEKRRNIIHAINGYLDHFQAGKIEVRPELQAERELYYDAASGLLQDRDYERIALFLPFETIPDQDEDSDSANNFRIAYLDAWQNLLFAEDVRENFNRGDVLEVDARPADPERVIKAAHLTPWLIQKGLFATSNVLDLLELENDPTLSRSFLDALPMMQDLGQVTEAEMERFQKIASALPEKPSALPPKYISLARKTWLKESAKAISRPSDPTSALTTLSQPITERINDLTSEITTAETLARESDSVILLGGSRLKGYSRDNSDVDLHVIDSDFQSANLGHLSSQQIIAEPSEYAHEVFNTIAVGDATKIQDVQRKLTTPFFLARTIDRRRAATEKLEQDLLEYRLLHKGYARLCPDTNPEYKEYASLDGQSSFYETGYRIIATKIFANSIFIPKCHN